MTQAQLEEEQKEEEMRRIQVAMTQKEEVKKKKKNKEAFIDDLVSNRPLLSYTNSLQLACTSKLWNLYVTEKTEKVVAANGPFATMCHMI